MPKSDDQDTKQRLIDATLEEIVERGWGGVRTRSVAHRAGVNNGLVHYHFGSIEKLKLEAAAAAIARLAEDFDPEALTTDRPFSEILAAFGAHIGDAQLDDPVWQALMEIFGQVPRNPALAEMATNLLDAYRAAVAQRLSEAVATGEIPVEIDVEGLAVALTAMLDGLGLHVYMDRSVDTARAGAAVGALFEWLAVERKEHM